MRTHGLALTLAIAAAAQAQIVNPDFETGAFAPWTVTPTAHGGTFGPYIGLYDIDGPGPLGTTQAAAFMVGRSGTTTGYEGVVLAQTVQLVGGFNYVLSFYYSTQVAFNAYNASAGRFELMINDVVRLTVDAP